MQPELYGMSRRGSPSEGRGSNTRAQQPAADFIQGPGPDPTLTMTTPQMLASWYSGEQLDMAEVRSLWAKSAFVLIGLWVLSRFAPS